MNVADEIGKLNNLRKEGALTDDEFEKAKAALLAKPQSASEKIKKTMDGVATGTIRYPSSSLSWMTRHQQIRRLRPPLPLNHQNSRFQVPTATPPLTQVKH